MRAKIVALGLVAGLSAQFQAAALVIVVMLGKSLAGGHRRYEGNLGPLRLHISNLRLIAFGMVAVVAAGVLDTTVSWFKSRMTTSWDFVHREQVIHEYLHADFQTQSAERLGTLALITGYVQRGASLLGAIAGGIMSGLSLLVYIGFALLIDYRAALLMVGAVVFLSIVLRPVMARVKRYSQALSAAMIVYNRDVTEATRMVRDLRVFDALTPLGEDLTQLSRTLLGCGTRAGSSIRWSRRSTPTSACSSCSRRSPSRRPQGRSTSSRSVRSRSSSSAACRTARASRARTRT